GFQANHVLTMGLRLPLSRYDTAARLVAFERQLLSRIRALGSVSSAGVVNSLPIAGFQGASMIAIEGRPAPKSLAAGMIVGQRVISPDYFKTMGTALLAGRDFTDRDAENAPRVAVINQALAHRYFPNEDPLGKRIRIDEPGEVWQTIVGVTASIHHSG